MKTLVSKTAFITQPKVVPEYFRELKDKNISKWYCKHCKSRQPIEYNNIVKSKWTASFNVLWFIKCSTCNNELKPETYFWRHELKEKWYCKECCEPTKITYNKLWLKFTDDEKRLFDINEIINDDNGKCVAICSVCGVDHSRWTFESSSNCPGCGWEYNEDSYEVNGKKYPRYEGIHTYYEGGESWEEFHFCHFCKKEFGFSDSN